MDAAWGCSVIAMKSAVEGTWFAGVVMILIVAGQRRRWSDFFLSVRLVVENHVTRSTPETRPNRSQSHVWRAQLKQEG